MLDELKELFNITDISKIEFKEMYGFTFVFKSRIILINDNISSAEMKPLAIIYEENDDFYLAPLDVVEDIDGIVEEFVKNYLFR